MDEGTSSLFCVNVAIVFCLCSHKSVSLLNIDALTTTRGREEGERDGRERGIVKERVGQNLLIAHLNVSPTCVV